jgi:hypothetical protein
MARIRTIKPDFFTSEDVVTLSPLARLLYIATWQEADREGRFVWRPKTLKLRYLPGDQCDIDQLAAELVSSGLVVPYQAGAQTYAEIPTFAKHQVINNRESASTIPPRATDASCTRDQRVTDATTTPLMGKEGKGKEGKDIGEDADASSVAGQAADHCPHQEIIDLYHRTLPTGRQVRLWTPAREAKLRARWREDEKRQSIEWWEKLFSYIAWSDFLTGKTHTPGRPPFELDLEWIITPANLVKIIEGKYHSQEASE